MVSNQKVVRVIKARADRDNIYAVFNNRVMFEAMRRLTSSGYKMWAYLGMNQDGYEFDLSPEDVHNKTGMCRATYFKAIKELIEKGYLVRVELYPNLWGYLFIEHGDSDAAKEQE